MSRSRFDGGAEELYEVLAPFVVHVSWLHYVEKVNHPVQPAILIAHKALFAACMSIAPNLAFTQTVVKEVFTRLVHERAFPTITTPTQTEDWIDTMTKRFRCACRHIASNRVRKSPPQWLRHFGGMAAISDSHEGQAGEAASGSADPQASRYETNDPTQHHVLHTMAIVLCSFGIRYYGSFGIQSFGIRAFRPRTCSRSCSVLGRLLVVCISVWCLLAPGVHTMVHASAFNS
jgi:hypothetical protein